VTTISCSQRRAARFGLGVLAAFAMALVACDGSDERPPLSHSDEGRIVPALADYDTATADTRDVYASGGCQDGATQTCRIYLPSHDGVQPCFVGEQQCADAAWGECADAVLVDANADDAELEADQAASPAAP
jgi:hypothetical protein